MVKYIYYTGRGSKKNGKHSVKEFLDIMNKNFNIQCSEFLSESDSDYKPCRDYTKTNNSKKYKKLLKQCNKYKKNTKKRKCNLDEYINFSGAEQK